VDVMTALADAVRRDILVMLRRGPLPAGAIAAAFPISRPAVSRHLRVLREHGLVVEESTAGDGRERVYRLETAPLGEVESWLAQFRNDWPSMLDALETEVQRTRRERRQTKPGGRPNSETRNTA
jgi:DNA-binding transcriptional ArsR family regulator